VCDWDGVGPCQGHSRWPEGSRNESMTTQATITPRPASQLPASKPQRSEARTMASHPAASSGGELDALMAEGLSVLPAGLVHLVQSPIGQARALPKTARADYLRFCATVIRDRGGVCQGCGRTAGQAGQRSLHLHHVWPVSKTGVHHPLVVARCNVLSLCDWCHSLQHPLKRDYAWGQAGSQRGKALA